MISRGGDLGPSGPKPRRVNRSCASVGRVHDCGSLGDHGPVRGVGRWSQPGTRRTGTATRRKDSTPACGRRGCTASPGPGSSERCAGQAAGSPLLTVHSAGTAAGGTRAVTLRAGRSLYPRRRLVRERRRFRCRTGPPLRLDPAVIGDHVLDRDQQVGRARYPVLRVAVRHIALHGRTSPVRSPSRGGVGPRRGPERQTRGPRSRGSRTATLDR